MHVAAPAEVADTDGVGIGFAALVLELGKEEDGDGGDDEEEAVPLAPVAHVEAPVLGDVVQRLLLYVHFLSFCTQLIHALSRLIRNVVQRLLRVM